MLIKKNVGKRHVLILIIITLFFYGKNHSLANYKEININTSSNGFLFNSSNLKPGDWITRTITIINEGSKDFKYIAKIGKSKSTKGLFEELKLSVQKGNETLFDGNLKDFTGFTPRKLAIESSETLLFEVTMPTYLDNSFQGSTAEVEIIFLAESVHSAGSDKDVPANGEPTNPETVIHPKIVSKLPNTATINFNGLFFGLALFTLGSIALFFSQKIRRNKKVT